MTKSIQHDLLCFLQTGDMTVLRNIDAVKMEEFMLQKENVSFFLHDSVQHSEHKNLMWFFIVDVLKKPQQKKQHSSMADMVDNVLTLFFTQVTRRCFICLPTIWDGGF